MCCTQLRTHTELSPDSAVPLGSIVLVSISIGYDNVAVTVVNAEIWQHDVIAAINKPTV